MSGEGRPGPAADEPEEDPRKIATGMTLADISIRNHVFAWMLMAALILFGAIGYARLGVSQNPDVDFPVINVSVALEGASPEVVETDVIEVLEDSVVSIDRKSVV